MVPDSPRPPDSLLGDMRNLRSLGEVGWWQAAAWRLFQLCTGVALLWAGWRLLGHTPYRIDIDVYRMGGRAWLDDHPLYSDGIKFHTRAGLDLPFTYPPLAAIAFAPFAMLSLPAASAMITVVTLLLLIVSIWIVLTRLDVAERWPTATGAPWLRRIWLAAAIVAPAVLLLEPIKSNFEFGQINVVLMTLVIADCVPRTTAWPRGVILGIAIALKLTPAVFLLYFLLRRDTRALITTAASAIVASLVGFVFAWTDSVEYWTETIRDTDRIGTATYFTNQNIAGILARLGFGEDLRFGLWVVACFAVLALTVWAARRVLRVGEPMLALMCVAMFGLVVSPVSWSHHWVWVLPTLLVMMVSAYRLQNAPLAAVGAVGVVLTAFVAPMELMPVHHESAASLWRQLAGGAYVWWALAVIIVIGTVATRSTATKAPALDAAPVVAAK
jgi:alpha-1,2-mannosyltransferase